MVSTLPSQWGFMKSWYTALNSLFVRTHSTVRIVNYSSDREPVIQFAFGAARADNVQELREMLALIVTVLWVDPDELTDLVKHFQLRLDIRSTQPLNSNPALGIGEQPALIEIILTDGTRGFYSPYDVVSIRANLISLFQELSPQNTSDTFQQTWKRIVTIAASKQIVLKSENAHSVSVANVPSAAAVDLWETVQNAVSANHFQWGMTSDSVASCIRGSRRDFYCNFIIDSVRVNSFPAPYGYGRYEWVDFTPRGSSLYLTEAMSAHVRLSTLELFLTTRRDLHEMWRLLVGLFCARPCSNSMETKQRIVDCVQVKFYYHIGSEFHALCAALAVSSCSSVEIEVPGGASPTAWQWLAYGLFSKRARSRSCVTRIKLTQADLSVDVVDAMAKVLLSPSPEQELLNSVQNATIASQNEEREFHVNENAVVRGSKRDGNTVVTWESTDIFCGRDVSRVQILGTGDGESEWVDVMCPGIGLCKLQRRSLVECQHAVRMNSARMNSAANLQLQLSTRHTSTRQGFPRFMELIGPWLQSLQISFPVAGDVSWIISSCPNLSDLIIDSGTIAAQPFVSAWEENHTRLRRLECSFDDICIILNALKRESSPMAQHLKRLAFGLESFPMVPPNTPNHPVLHTLQEIFAVNRVLQNMIVTFTGNGGYCNVKAFEEGLKTYNLQELATKGDDLPMQCKTAFMSIFSCHDALSRRSKRSVRRSHSRMHLQALDADTMSTIFEFAASRGVRRIVVATLQIERPIDWWV